MKITENSYQFAKKWYDPNEIHRSILSRQKEVPTNVTSREFAEFLSEISQLAMMKGAQLAIEEIKQMIKEGRALGPDE